MLTRPIQVLLNELHVSALLCTRNIGRAGGIIGDFSLACLMDSAYFLTG